MRIRIMQYSLSVKQLLAIVGLTFITIILISGMGFVNFIAACLMGVTLCLVVRSAIFWFTWDGPLVENPKQDCIIAVSCGIVSMILFLI